MDSGSYSRRRTQTPTPQFEPAPSHIQADLRRHVHWGGGVPEQDQRRQEEDEERDNKDFQRAERRYDENRDQVEEEEEEQGEEAMDDRTVLAISSFRGQLGCCYYDGESKKLYFIEDSEDSEAHSWDLLVMILEHTNPHMVLTPATADPSFLTTLASTLELLPVLSTTSAASSTSASEDHSQVQLEYRPGRDFATAAGRSALAQVDIHESGIYSPQEDLALAQEEEDEDASNDAYDFGRRRKRQRLELDGERGRRNRELRLASFLNFLESSPLTLGCAGALIQHLSRSIGVTGELDTHVQVTGVQLLKMDQIMQVNQDSLQALQIFSSQNHASVHSDRTKEGLSLYGLLNCTRTPMGRSLLRRWLLRPSLRIDLINSRQDVVECFLRSENKHPAETIQSNLRFIKNVPRALRLIAHSRAGTGDWMSLFKFIFAILQIRDSALLLNHTKRAGIIHSLLESFDAIAFKELGGNINDIIDWDESNLQKRLCVRSNVNPQLDELRRQYAGLPSLLSRVASDISREIPSEFTSTLSVVYFPQLGYLIAIPRDELDDQPPEWDGWDFQFTTEHSTYYKSEKCRDLDNHLGDVKSFAADKEIEILDVLGAELMKHEAEMIAACGHLAELDCLLSFAEVARVHEWNRPTITKDNVCIIRQGSHPLVELCVTAFVKNDTHLVGGQGVERDYLTGGEADVKPVISGPGEDGSMMVITGANFSGKSIYLKQVALLIFMAHIGSFIPAEEAVIGLTDRIMTRISTRETISRGSSAFMIDLQQISFALRNATSRSLILIDEFGKGTASDDGAGLFVGVLEHLILRGADTPRTLVATHFTNVLANELLSPTLPIAYAHMEIIIRATQDSESSSSTAPPQITYLYRLAPGLSRNSHAAACASLFGIDDVTVARATYVTSLLSRFEIDKLLNEALTPDERAELEDCEAIARRFLSLDLTAETCGEEPELEKVLGMIRFALEGVARDEDEEVEEENDENKV